MKNRSSIYFIIPSMAGGGAEKVLTIILNCLDREKFSPKLVLFKKSGPYINEIPADVEVFDLKKMKKLDVFKLIFKLRRIIKDKKPDVLVSFLDYTNVITVLASLFLKHRPRIILSERSCHRMYLPHERLRFIRTALMYFSYKKASKIIAISKGIKDALVEDFKVDASRVVVIYNPIDIKKIQSMKEEDAAGKFFRDSADRPILISAGRLERAKNFELLIRAFTLVRKKVPAYLIIVGDGKLKNHLEALAKQLGVDSFIDFVGFQINPFAWITRSDLFVSSSRWEGFGNVIIEAMACGVPVVATDCPVGPGEIIIDRKNGILVESNNVDSMSEAILELLASELLRNAIKKEALQYVEMFDVMKIFPQYEKAFEDGK